VISIRFLLENKDTLQAAYRTKHRNPFRDAVREDIAKTVACSKAEDED
jgi:hypothetical protein